MEKKTAAMAGALFHLTISFVASLNSIDDESSLLAIKSQIDSEILSKNWTQQTSFCNWIGVSCSRRRQRVAALDLSGMGLRGGISREIGNLSFLTLLNINSNILSGPIPEEIGKLRRLRVLDMAMNQLSDGIPQTLGLLGKLENLNLSNNYLSGNIPQNLSASRHLTKLDLSSNNLTGNIPSHFGDLSQLQGLLLFDNQLTGTLPPSTGNLSKLEIIDISRNSFHGTIPLEIGTLSTLRFLSLELNYLNGEVPHSIFNLSALQVLALGSNNLSGTLPFSTHQGIPNIQEIYLDINQFHGSIPDSISNLSHLRWLDLSTNSFTGQVPITLGNLHQLKLLNLADNHLMNNISNPDEDFLSSLTACNYLSFLAVSANPITGALPKSLGIANLSASLETFLVYACNITGQIPDEIGNLSKLIWLDLRINGLSGVVPTTLGHLSNLQKLELSFNQLQGSISHFICDLKNLYSIRLVRNNFSGHLPSCLGGLPLLGDIYFSDNAFTSNIPSTLWSAQNVQNLILFNNFFDGSLPQEIGNLKSLIELDLSGNQLSGQIPTTISQLQNLLFLSFSNNKFEGLIPDSFAEMNSLQHLDLSQNNLSGPIPESLEKLLYLNYFNVSFNNLSGEIPDTEPYVNFTAQSFAGNKGLCGAPRFKVKACRSSKNKIMKYIIAPVIVAAFILVTVIIYYGRKSPTPSSPTLPLVPTRKRISHREILEATRNLNEENLIGRGGISSVYKGIFSDAMVAAVKVFNLEIQDAFKSFDVECQVLSSVRHRNLVEVITSCSNLDFKAVVMAYMPNGSLERWLYSADCSLNFLQRVGIMIDVASALEYLHQWHTFPIIHCDIKPSNILLDEDMVAHVADFGIAKLLTEEHRMQLTTTLGTIGYMAPEYGSEGLVSSMVDVYSYGVLLMEILVRRKPTDAMFSGEFNMKRWVLESFPDSVMEIVDDDLINMDADQSVRGRHERFLISCVEVALECTAELAEERPEMKDVAARIKKIKLSMLASN